jgi:hypothetical protein
MGFSDTVSPSLGWAAPTKITAFREASDFEAKLKMASPF